MSLSAVSGLYLSCKWLRWSRPDVRLGVAWVKQIGFVFFSQGALVCIHPPVLCQLQAADQVLRKCSSPLNVRLESGRTVLENGYKHKNSREFCLHEESAEVRSSFRQAGPNPPRARKRAETCCDLHPW